MNFRHFLYQVFLLSVFGLNPAGAAFGTSINEPVVRVYQIENPARHLVCSATLLRNPMKGSECRLVTNAHCVSSLTDHVLLSSDAATVSTSIAAFFRPRISPTEVKILRVDRSYDLAELSIPIALQGEICSELPEIENNQIQEIDLRAVDKNNVKPNASKIIFSYASLGYSDKKSVAHFTDDVDWSIGRGYSELFKEITSLPSLNYFYHFPNLQILNGMSGGPTIDERGQLIGINVRLVPYRDDSSVIPVKDLLRFLSLHSDSAVPGASGGNGSQNAGGNSGGNAGGNSGGNAGEETETTETESPLSSLREPDEGVVINSSGVMRRLLGRGPFQIDGLDDVRAHEGETLPSLYRDSADFFKIQKQLFRRLEGEFNLPQAHFFDPNDRYLERSSDGRWVTKQKSSVRLRLKIKRLSDSEALIRIYVSDSKLITTAQDVIYKATMSDDFKTVTLTSAADGATLTCVNKNYLKLVCHSQIEELSFSYSEIQNPNVSFRYSKLNPDVRSARYSFGTLVRAAQ